MSDVEDLLEALLLKSEADLRQQAVFHVLYDTVLDRLWERVCAAEKKKTGEAP